MASFNTLSDDELLILLNSGNEFAFDEIYRRFWKALFTEANRRLRNIVKSEEVVQEIFTQLWVKRGQTKIENLFPYLKSSVRYQVYMLYKKEKNLPNFEEPIEDMASSSLHADSIFFEKELKASIELWLSMQPEKRKEIFRLRFLEEYSTKEISEMLDISQKTVQKTLSTAILNLRGFLGKYIILASILMTTHNAKL